MEKREATDMTVPAPHKGGKTKKALAVIFYALTLAIYAAVTVWRFSLEGEPGWQYFPAVMIVILPLGAFLTAGLMGYFKSFLFWLAPVAQVALFFLYQLVAFRDYAPWPQIIIVAVASLGGIIVGLVLRMLRERAKGEKRRKKKKELIKAEEEKAVGETLKEFTKSE